MKNEPMLRRFWRYVDTTPGQGPKGDCWCWLGVRVGVAGYGQFTTFGRARSYVHRVSFELEHGVDLVAVRSGGPLVCHSCDNPPCVNPDHLFLGSGVDNAQDMIRKGRQAPAPQFGEHNPQAILTAADVRAIRADTRKLTEIATAFGIAVSTTSQVRTRKLWPHVR